MLHRRCLRAILLWASVLTACDDPSTDSAGALTPEKYAAGLAEILCDHVFSCCPEGTPGTTTYEGCLMVEQEEQSLQGLDSLPGVVFRGESARRCIEEMKEALADLSCTSAVPRLVEFASCQTVVAGRGGAGASCTIDLDCAPGLQCSAGGDEGGVCYALRQQGEPCGAEFDQDFRCQAGLSCSEGQCRPPAGRGEACGAVPCQPGLACLAGTAEEPVPLCGDLIAEGQPCTGFDCAEGLHCPLLGSQTGHCAPRKALGETCSSDSECLSGRCGSESTCIPILECRSVDVPPAGEE